MAETPGPGPEYRRSLFSFVDMLEPRRRSSDLAWVSRRMSLTKAFNQLRSKSDPEVLKYTVLQSQDIADIVDEFSSELNLPKENVRLKVLDILNEVGYSRCLPVVRWLGLILIKILKKTLNSLYVNEDKLNQLRKQWGSSPVLFLPSHRSYGDFILMALLCFHYNIEIPCVAAGMDFHSMYLMGSMLRDCSAYFMRRAYGEDKLYWRIFHVYVRHLVTEGVAPLEFFIEGTRSRTGKPLYPKLGLLSMVLGPLMDNLVSDITIIPVSISYDRALEEGLFAWELLGIPKPKESTSGFIKAVNTLNEQYGSIYIDFADAISVRQFLASVNPTLHSNHLLYLGHEVLIRQQNSSVLSLFNVLSVLLSHHHITHPSSQPPLLLSHATKFLSWFAAILESLGALVDVPNGGVVLALKDSIQVHSSLVHIETNNDEQVLCSTSTQMNVTTIDSSKLKGHKLQVSTMKESVTLMSINNYVNPCLSFVIDAALVCILLLRSPQNKLNKDSLLRQYIHLREIFMYEFVFYTPLAEQRLKTTLSQLVSLHMVDMTTSNDICLIQSNYAQYLCSILVTMLYPYVYGYCIACSVLLEKDTNSTTSSCHPEKLLIKNIQGQVEVSLQKGSLRHPYPLSLDLIGCCLSGLTHQNALTRVKRNNGVEYTVHKDSLATLHDDLNQVLDTLVKHIPNHKPTVTNQKSKL
uniref:Dihydroxyacetone phosphate acyltransferase n=1 Tax=Cacopsylla melanoneura TaxID=428564 RepID=A0A8D8TXG3_9HEMI